MIERKDVMPINFLKKENFTGSYKGMRYRMEKAKKDEEPALVVAAWPEPYCYAATPDEEKIRETFDFTEQGVTAGVEWLNNQYSNFK